MQIESVSTELQSQATCPNCWSPFSVENVKWITAHDSLVGDVRLGPDAQQRILPTRFDIAGNGIDIRGSCHQIDWQCE